MRVFVTGAAGYIGQAVSEAFRTAGHTVFGLVRSEENARALRCLEVNPVIGDLSNPNSFMDALSMAEVVVHCAFENSPRGVQLEEYLIKSILLSLQIPKGVSKGFIYTSGIWNMGNTGNKLFDESSPNTSLDLVKWRVPLEEMILGAASTHLRTVVIRPGCVYGGSKGLTTDWFLSAQRGFVEIAGSGDNHWAMVHRQDLAHAYVLAAEKEINGVVFNIVDDSHHTVKQMAISVASASGIDTTQNLEDIIRVLPSDEMIRRYGKLVEGLLADQYISNERAKRLLGWQHRHRDFVSDVDLYYSAWKSAQIK